MPGDEQLQFEDQRFASADWTLYYADAHFAQRYHHEEGGRLYCETLLALRSTTAEPVIELLRGPWSWWDHGRVLEYRELPDGGSEQVLAPVWWFLTRVRVRLFPPYALPGEAGIRLPGLLGGHFLGTASTDVLSHDDVVVVRGRFHGVRSRVPVVTPALAGHMHLRAEAGTFTVPFPARTGWCGLCRRLENQCTPSGCLGEFFPGSPQARPSRK